MIDGNLLRLLAEAGEIRRGQTVIEVGPGTGSLTEELLAAGARVVAVEIDRDLAQLLRDRIGDRADFTLIEADALDGKHALCPELRELIAGATEPVSLVANLPYQIASPLVIEMLIAGVELLAFTVQREVAQRLKAVAGDDQYGPLSVMANLLAEVEILRRIPPQAFWPAPKIESSLVRMRRHDRLGNDAAEFSRFVHSVFSYRRKMIRKAMTQAGFAEDVAEGALSAIGVNGNARPEEIGADQWLELFGRIVKR
jgi:16S rRNA (adenine1518-N6/adenine1519-N6)-dimethyltransferase